MKKAIAKIITVIFLVAVIPVVLLAVGFLTPGQYGETFYGVLPQMVENLKINRKKIVIIGNSSVAFGVDSEIIERELAFDGLDYAVCNFGLYGQIGTKAMLDLSEKYINGGDIVIIAPETDSRAVSLYFSGIDFLRGIDGNMSLINSLAWGNVGEVCAAFPQFVAEKSRFFRTSPAAGDGVYASASFNERCDMKNVNRDYNKMLNGYDANNPVSLDADTVSEKFTDYLNAYAKKLNKRGAEVYYSFSPINRSGLSDGSPSTVKQYFDVLDELLDFPVISDLNAYIMDSEWFFDTNFHLNSAGMTVRSILLTEDIKNIFGISTPVKTAMPQKPEIPKQEETDGDNSFAECFEYELTDRGYIITALKADKKELTEIVLPTNYKDIAVISFNADVFAGNGTIKRITVQKNIVSLPDGAFAGCSSLEKLTITQTSPDKIGVGYGLLEGADKCMIAVPDEAGTAYLMNYFWSYYAGRLQFE